MPASTRSTSNGKPLAGHPACPGTRPPGSRSGPSRPGLCSPQCLSLMLIVGCDVQPGAVGTRSGSGECFRLQRSNSAWVMVPSSSSALAEAIWSAGARRARHRLDVLIRLGLSLPGRAGLTLGHPASPRDQVDQRDEERRHDQTRSSTAPWRTRRGHDLGTRHRRCGTAASDTPRRCRSRTGARRSPRNSICLPFHILGKPAGTDRNVRPPALRRRESARYMLLALPRLIQPGQRTRRITQIA